MFDDDRVDLRLDDSRTLDQRQFGHRDDRIREAVEIAFRHAAVTAYHREAGYFLDHLMGFGKADWSQTERSVFINFGEDAPHTQNHGWAD